MFKTKYCSSYLYTNFVLEMGHMKFSVYFGTHIYSKDHEYALWQYERTTHKSMMNRLIVVHTLNAIMLKKKARNLTVN